MNPSRQRTLFFLFFLSGASSLVYQVVWTRLAFAAFGIITPVLSVVLSVFMLGLSVGSWGGGRLIPSIIKKGRVSAIFYYAAVEGCIGLGAFLVPRLFAMGQHLLLTSGEADSFRYLSLSAIVLAVSILPWCICMGATFPLMMAYVRECDAGSRRSFSFLYLANVLGAMSGVFFTAVVWIEMFGFHHTLWIAAAGNFTVALISIYLGRGRSAAPEAEKTDQGSPAPTPAPAPVGSMRALLFLTGFISMAMEVVWTRAFTPVLKTQVYSFAAIVFTYLGATFFGSWLYRRHLRSGRVITMEQLIFLVLLAAFLPVLVNDPRFLVEHFWTSVIDKRSALIILGSIGPFCALLGYLTPQLVDYYSNGNPTAAGKAYAINVIGCILGPLFACYLLLPFLSERHSLLLLTVPFLVLWLTLSRRRPRGVLVRAACAAPVLAAGLWLTEDFETAFVKASSDTVIRRDYAASVVCYREDKDVWLVVNGIDMTRLTPITKFMVHLPMALCHQPPRSALVICFGMGTSYRSALNWDIDTTAVELVPGVPKSFAFFHPDTARYLDDPHGHIVVDDGRRYLNRCGKKFDVIVVDPPPPVEAAGSSLLYSKEFDALAREHLNPGGILQIWLPGSDHSTRQAVMRSLHETFPYVRSFVSVEKWGLHFLASTEPIDVTNGKDLAARMPESARKDLVEWTPSTAVAPYLDEVLTNEVPADQLLDLDPTIKVTDDRPYNEYFLIRRTLDNSPKVNEK